MKVISFICVRERLNYDLGLVHSTAHGAPTQSWARTWWSWAIFISNPHILGSQEWIVFGASHKHMLRTTKACSCKECLGEKRLGCAVHMPMYKEVYIGFCAFNLWCRKKLKSLWDWRFALIWHQTSRLAQAGSAGLWYASAHTASLLLWMCQREKKIVPGTTNHCLLKIISGDSAEATFKRLLFSNYPLKYTARTIRERLIRIFWKLSFYSTQQKLRQKIALGPNKIVIKMTSFYSWVFFLNLTPLQFLSLDSCFLAVKFLCFP